MVLMVAVRSRRDIGQTERLRRSDPLGVRHRRLIGWHPCPTRTTPSRPASGTCCRSSTERSARPVRRTSGASATNVTGTLYLDDTAYFEFGSIQDALVNYPQADEVAALPYQYTIK
jgi:hypothetical protein